MPKYPKYLISLTLGSLATSAVLLIYALNGIYSVVGNGLDNAANDHYLNYYSFIINIAKGFGGLAVLGVIGIIVLQICKPRPKQIQK